MHVVDGSAGIGTIPSMPPFTRQALVWQDVCMYCTGVPCLLQSKGCVSQSDVLVESTRVFQGDVQPCMLPDITTEPAAARWLLGDSEGVMNTVHNLISWLPCPMGSTTRGHAFADVVMAHIHVVP